MHGDDDMGPLDTGGLAQGIADSIFGDPEAGAIPETAPLAIEAELPECPVPSKEQQGTDFLERIEWGYPTPADLPEGR
jgi:hypothetical protein